MRHKAYLTAADVGKLWGEERDQLEPDNRGAGRPISRKTVYAMVWHATNEAGRYYGYPMPALPEYPNPDLPRAGQHMQWWPEEGQSIEDLERALRHWWRHRPPAGSGNPPGPPPVYGDDVVALVRDHAEAGASDTEIAAVLAARYGKTPAGKDFSPGVVGGIRRRHHIASGAEHRRLAAEGAK